MIKFPKTLLTVFTCIFALYSFQTDTFAKETEKDSASAQNEIVQSKKDSLIDTLDDNFPEKLRARKPWEYVVSLPVWIATSPLWLLYKGTAAIIGFVDDHDIPEKVERVLISEDGTREIMPEYSSRTGAGISFLKKGLISSESELKIIGSYWLLHRHGVQFDFLNLEPKNNVFFADIRFLYEYVPDDPFFGIGPETKKSAETNYTHREIEGALALGKNIHSTLKVTMSGTLGQHKISDGKDKDFPSIATLDSRHISKVVLAGLHLAIDLDTRDKKGHSTTGTLLKITGGFRDEIRKLGGHDTFRNETFGFSLFNADLSQFLHLPWSTGRVLVLRVGMETREELQNKIIPFYFLSELGSDGTIRGFQRGRFRDRDALLGSLEYRYPIWADFPNSLDAVLFVDAGQVTDNLFSNLRRKHIRFGFGGGFRFYNDEDDALAGKVMFGFSKDEYRIQFALND